MQKPRRHCGYVHQQIGAWFGSAWVVDPWESPIDADDFPPSEPENGINRAGARAQHYQEYLLSSEACCYRLS